MRTYFEQDFDGFVSNFIKSHYTQDGDTLLAFLDGSLHCFNGTHYEASDASHRSIMTQVRQFVKTLSFTDKKGKPIKTTTSPLFYKNFFKTLEDLCEPSESELELFRQQDKDLVFGKTKAYRISTREFEPYNHRMRNRFVLDYDVAEEDCEPEVWKEFFEAAQMDEEQQLSWWRQRSVIVMRDNRHNRLFFHFGNPRSGKGTTTAIDTAFFGKSGVASIPRGVGSNPHALGVIVGKSLLTINDMKFDKNVNNCFIQFLLNLVGDDPISINPKHKPIFDYHPIANIVISSNEVPNFRGNLSGLENKFVFNVFQRDESKSADLLLKQRMLDTMPYIIRKAILMYPETVESGYAFDTERGKAIRDRFSESASVCIRYINECCTFGEGFNDCSEEIYEEFREFAHKQGEHKPSQSQFNTEIMTHFLGKIDKKRIYSKSGRRVTVLTGIRRNWRGDTINDPAPRPVPPGLIAPKSVSSFTISVGEHQCTAEDVPF